MVDEGFVNPQELLSRAGIRSGMHVADFGSGSGDIAILMAKAVGEEGVVTALDVLPSALESVSVKAKNLELKNLNAIRANLEILGSSTLQEHSQDVVFLANILWQSSKKKEILEEAVRVLKPGGVLVAVEWTKQTPAGPPPTMRIGEDELQQLVRSVGLQYIETFPAGGFHYEIIAKKS